MLSYVIVAVVKRFEPKPAGRSALEIILIIVNRPIHCLSHNVNL